ncbi:Tripeptidyl aminopeptidase precursor [Streptomyces sp. YIM 130001]|uniref:alpha/beta hydrolase n=1 Tax=Streptomyces sp. YIM 130001 TaxID=2259644 RepID=UPI000E650F94|nr:alpha/beta hydrolase [Streptomyces sp. YIM 130001]RII06844.1 Tripeptidyl aminopeptidase precursor [Streptomyces sp. YIM 130001]
MRKRAVAVLGTAAVLSGMITASPSAAGTGAPAVRAAPAPRAVNWTDCSTDTYPTLQCATVKAPLDHDRPGGRQISLALSRVPHTAKKSQGPLLVNPGGPGGSGRSLAGFVARSLPKDVASQYDVIGFDPRGVGASKPALDCKPGYFDPVRPDSLPAGGAAERANLARVKDFAESCGTKHGPLLRYMDSVSAAEDMDVIRRALGAERINYLGYSYGTYLGAVYAKLHPERVRRAVLDSVVDPSGVWYENNLGQNTAFESRQQAFTAWVAKHDTTYGLGQDPAEVEAQWTRTRQALARKPAGGKVGPAELEDTFLPGGYYNGYWPDLAEAFAAYANDGKTEPLVEAYKKFGAVDAAGDNGYSVYTAVQCRDAGWPRNWNQWRHDMWRSHAKAPFITWNNAWYNAPCAFWPTRSLEPTDVTNAKLPPVLLFQATEDAATPYEGAVSLHHRLRGSSLVVEEGGANHGVTLAGNDCLDRHLADYLATGKVPRSTGAADATCEALPDPEPAKAARTGSSDGADRAPSRGAQGAALHGLLGHRS